MYFNLCDDTHKSTLRFIWRGKLRQFLGSAGTTLPSEKLKQKETIPLELTFELEFYVNAVLPKSVSSFIALIPKTDHPQSLSEYGPISLIGSINKIMSKLLANRLKKALSSIISPTPGRQIMDGVLITNELVDWGKRFNRKFLIFKDDFQKAYGSVSLGFQRESEKLDQIMCLCNQSVYSSEQKPHCRI